MSDAKDLMPSGMKKIRRAFTDKAATDEEDFHEGRLVW
jgi:hypothetical protein